MKAIMRASFYLTLVLGVIFLVLSVFVTAVPPTEPTLAPAREATSTPTSMPTPLPTSTPTPTPMSTPTPTPMSTPTPTPPTPTATPPPPPSTSLTPLERAREVKTATVLIYVYVPGAGGSYGSGSIVSKEGLILTNFHVVGDCETGQLYNGDELAKVAVTTLPYGQADPRYQAEVLEWDTDLDLAVLQIVAGWYGHPLQEELDLYPVPLGDSDT
jgi:S1-C subfamily serine protease